MMTNWDTPNGCYIGQNVRILEDISFFIKQNQLPGIPLSIAVEKAFASLNWNLDAIVSKSLSNIAIMCNNC